ncbi:putative short chain dehydrogenase/ reductase [Aspergillus pseudoustus]|uniref:Short chain dehydrogenase/ reductase n=1 Tax=Aspergillus pseudoustus TaxID=1810923 RepID=A0ABR4II43_9EURO
MSTPAYQNSLVDVQKPFDFTKVSGKTVVLTGGSSGLGLCYVRAFVKSGAFVVNGDIKPPAESFSSDRVVYVKCDVTKWEDQVTVFETARARSPNGGIDIVIANAGIYGPDALDGLTDASPAKPETKLLDVNLVGVIYTSKLAGWHFANQDQAGDRDRCLILVTSIMGYIDTQGSSVYSAAKHGVRGLMTCLRRKGVVRVNCLAPWFIATPILPESFIQSTRAQFHRRGLDFAKTDDAVTAVMRLATDTEINGRTLGVVPRQLSPSGYLDLDRDDFTPGSPLDTLQVMASSLVYGEFGASSAST